MRLHVFVDSYKLRMHIQKNQRLALSQMTYDKVHMTWIMKTSTNPTTIMESASR